MCIGYLHTMRREIAQKPKNAKRSVPKMQRILRETRKDWIISKKLECKQDREEVEAMIKEFECKMSPVPYERKRGNIGEIQKRGQNRPWQLQASEPYTYYL